MLKIIIIFLSLFFSTLITSQSLTWQRYFNLLTNDDEGWAVCKADGNNIYVGGLSSDPGVGAVLKLNQYGDTLWKKFYPDSYYIVSMQSLRDGGCLFTSYSGKFKRLNQSGNVVWSINAPPGDILLTSDDFIIIAGYGSYGKYGMDGSHIWTKTYTVWPSFGFATEAIDGGYLFGGSVNYKAFLLKTDTSGSILWDRQYSFSNTSYFSSILKLNGDYIIAGSYYGSTDSSTKFLMKLKPNGDSLSFQNVYSRMPYYNQSLLNFGNNNIYFFYNYVSPISNKYCIKIDLYDTNFIKKKHLIIEPKIHYLHINDAIVFPGSDNSRFAICGITAINGASNEDIYIASIDTSLMEPPPISIEPISSHIPIEFKLHQNYPNPFNPVTRIKFSIPAGSFGMQSETVLTIYDILGKEISVLLNDILSPGEYETEWNAVNYPSGVYFYTLLNGAHSVSGKMLLLK